VKFVDACRELTMLESESLQLVKTAVAINYTLRGWTIRQKAVL